MIQILRRESQLYIITISALFFISGMLRGTQMSQIVFTRKFTLRLGLHSSGVLFVTHCSILEISFHIPECSNKPLLKLIHLFVQ